MISCQIRRKGVLRNEMASISPVGHSHGNIIVENEQEPRVELTSFVRSRGSRESAPGDRTSDVRRKGAQERETCAR
jgi:hypothetical protein